MRFKIEKPFLLLLPLFMVIYPFLIFPVKNLFYVTIDKYAYLTLFIVSLWILWLFQWWKKEQPFTLMKTSGERVVLLFLGIVALSTAFSSNPFVSFFGSYYKFQGFLAWFNYVSLFLFSYHLISVHQQVKLIRWMVFASFFVGIYGIFQHFFSEYLVGKQDNVPFVMSWGFFDNPNHFGSYLLLMMLLSMILYLLGANQKERWLYGVITCTLLVPLLYTLSRGSWVGLFCGMLTLTVAIVWRRTYMWKRWGALMLGLFLVLQVTSFAGHNFVFSRLESVAGQQNTGSGRLWIWEHFAPLIKDHYLIGSGPSTFTIVFPGTAEEKLKYTGSKELDNSHNEYLEMAVTMGIPALLVYLSFIFIILKRCFVAARQFNGDKQILAYGFMAVIVGYMSKVFFNISVTTVAPFFWVLLGLCYALSSRKTKTSL